MNISSAARQQTRYGINSVVSRLKKLKPSCLTAQEIAPFQMGLNHRFINLL